MGRPRRERAQRALGPYDGPARPHSAEGDGAEVRLGECYGSQALNSIERETGGEWGRHMTGVLLRLSPHCEGPAARHGNAAHPDPARRV